MDLSHAIILEHDGTPFVLYREPQLSSHVEDVDPFPFPTHRSHGTISENPLSKPSKPIKPPTSQEFFHIKKPNPRPTILKKQ